MAETPKEIKVAVVTQRELELGQENQALRAYLKQSDECLDGLLGGIMIWMVGWRDDLNPGARAQMEEIIKYYDKSQVR